MVDLADMNDVYSEYVPDLENYIPSSCTYIGVDELSTLISSLSLSIFMLKYKKLVLRILIIF